MARYVCFPIDAPDQVTNLPCSAIDRRQLANLEREARFYALDEFVDSLCTKLHPWRHNYMENERRREAILVERQNEKLNRTPSKLTTLPAATARRLGHIFRQPVRNLFHKKHRHAADDGGDVDVEYVEDTGRKTPSYEEDQEEEGVEDLPRPDGERVEETESIREYDDEPINVVL